MVERPARLPDGRRFEPCSQLLRTSANHRMHGSGGGKSFLESMGLPVGEVVDLRGVWVEPPSLSNTKEPRRFEVTHVNRSRLRQPVAYLPHSVNQWNRDHVVSKTGDVWDMIAYEEIEVRQHSRLRERLKQPAAADYSGNLASILGEVVKINPQ